MVIRVVPIVIGMVGSLKDFVTSGTGAVTARVALATSPFPPLLDVGKVEFSHDPSTIPLTSIEKVQTSPGVRVGFEKLTRRPSRGPGGVVGSAVTTAPVQLTKRPFGFLIMTPGGKMSLNARLFSVTAEFGLLTVNVNCDVPVFKTIAFGVNFLVMEGGQSTVKVSLATRPIPPSSDEGADVVLTKSPQVAGAITVILIVHC